MDHLGKFLKYNKNLLQLDISHTLIRTNLLRELTTCLRRAKSLLTFNISGNPGISKELSSYLTKRIRCKPNPYDLKRLDYINDLVHDLNKTYDSYNKKNEKIL